MTDIDTGGAKEEPNMVNMVKMSDKENGWKKNQLN